MQKKNRSPIKVSQTETPVHRLVYSYLLDLSLILHGQYSQVDRKLQQYLRLANGEIAQRR